MRETRSLRRRYVAFKIDSPRPLRRKDVDALLRSILDEKTQDITLLTFDPETMRGILRCNHRNLDMVRSLLNRPLEGCAGVSTLRTSGTLKALRKELPGLPRSRRGLQA